MQLAALWGDDGTTGRYRYSKSRSGRQEKMKKNTREIPYNARVTVDWWKMRNKFKARKERGKEFRLLLPTNTTLPRLERAFNDFVEQVDPFGSDLHLTKPQLQLFCDSIGITVDNAEMERIWPEFYHKGEGDIVSKLQIFNLFVMRPLREKSRRGSRRSRRSRSRSSSRGHSRDRARKPATSLTSTSPAAPPPDVIRQIGRKMPFTNYKKFKHMNRKSIKEGKISKSKDEFGYCSSVHRGVPYETDYDRRLRSRNEKKKQMLAGEFTVCDHRAEVTRRERAAVRSRSFITVDSFNLVCCAHVYFTPDRINGLKS